jgi:hypothetical protein
MRGCLHVLQPNPHLIDLQRARGNRPLLLE